LGVFAEKNKIKLDTLALKNQETFKEVIDIYA
jgi:hypothetical protein